MISANQRLEQLRELAIETAQDMARSEALFLSIGEGAIATDEEGNINRINRTALEILGFEEVELMGHLLREVIKATDEHGVIIPEERRPITRSFKLQTTVTSRCYYICKDGSHKAVYITVSPIILDGKQVGAIEVFRDITREIEVERTQSDFISIASHQLRTPATAVKTYLAMLMEGLAGEDTALQQKYIRLAFESNERQLDIVNDLLVTASSEADSLVLKKKMTDVSRLVRETVDEFEQHIKRKEHVLRLVVKDNTQAPVDASYFKMVIENLISNACKYTPQGGQITVTLKSTPKKIELRVQDSGVGINPQQQGKLFKKFSRIENPLSGEAGGSGIGLYLVSQIVKLHEGTVAVDSEEDKGATFSVKLPRTN